MQLVARIQEQIRANEILALEKELEEAKEKALKDSKFAGEVTRIYNKLLEAKAKK